MTGSRRRSPAGPAVLRLPAEIDCLNARQVGEQLCSALDLGVSMVIADMTATTFCDCSGARELLVAHKKATAGGIELMLVMPSTAARRVFELTGLDRSLAIRFDWPPDLREFSSGDTRSCEQCSTVFTPRREHARFCCVACRAAWNRDHLGDPAAEAEAVVWSITAMLETTQRLADLQAWARLPVLALVGEAVWWITIVDATLVRHHQETYDRAMTAQKLADRQKIEQILTGLRYIRNQLGNDVDIGEFIESGDPVDAGHGHKTRWTWRPVPKPDLTQLPSRPQRWEMTRYRAYQAQLAGNLVGETLGLAAQFLKVTSTDLTASAESSVREVAVPTGPGPDY